MKPGIHYTTVNLNIRELCLDGHIAKKAHPDNPSQSVYKVSGIPAVGRIKLLDSYLRGAVFSPTQRALDNLIFRPTRLSQNKRKRIPAASEIKSYDHASVLLRAKWDRNQNAEAAW